MRVKFNTKKICAEHKRQAETVLYIIEVKYSTIHLRHSLAVLIVLVLAVLSANTAAYSFQDGRVSVQVSAWYGSVLFVDILRPNVITQRSVSSSLCRIWTTLCSTHDDELR